MCGIFDCRNIVGDPMETIYDEMGVRIDICRDWEYFEVFGLTNKEFAEIEKDDIKYELLFLQEVWRILRIRQHVWKLPVDRVQKSNDGDVRI